jgi:predicted outer membrane repeat protein
MNKPRPPALAAVILTIAASISHAHDIHVPGDAATLAEALGVATAGDRVILAPGVHAAANLTIPGGVTIEGDANDPGAVIIQASDSQRALRAQGIARADLIGLTITGGRASGSTNYDASGGGLLVSQSAVWLHRVRFVDNTATGGGGAIQVLYGEVHLSLCVLEDNHAAKGGGGVDLSYESNATFSQTRFAGNTAAWGGAISARTQSSCWLQGCELIGNAAVAPQAVGGAFFSDYAAVVAFFSCVLADNSARQGGAARLNGVSTTFRNCTIDGNSATEKGAGFMIRNSGLHLTQSIVSFNQGEGLAFESGAVLCSATNVFGNTSGDWIDVLEDQRDQRNNMHADPLYCGAGDYRLHELSPCAPENNPAGLIGAKGVGCHSVGIILQEFEAERQDQQVHLRWRVLGDEHEYRLQGRSLQESGGEPWIVPYRVGQAPGTYLAVDRPAAYLHALAYHLEARSTGGGDWFLLGELELEPLLDPLTPTLEIKAVFPNPFNPQVHIQFAVGRTARVHAAIYAVSGRLVRTLVRGELPPGSHTLTWDGADGEGRPQPSGTYLLKIDGGEHPHVSKLLLFK